MKLIRAHIENFRLLKSLVLNFSTDSRKRLTVIRAANDSGKTTCKTALLWCMFGNRALPRGGQKFPLTPSDMSNENQRVEISVEIEFDSDQVIPSGRGNSRIETRRYRLRRTCVEYPSAQDIVRREAETRSLMEISPEGSKIVEQALANRVLENSLPEALKDVYFTDGDSAMSFIEASATRGVRRKRVSDAIEALLELSILDDTTKDVRSARKQFGSMVSDKNLKEELEKFNDRIIGWAEDLEEYGREQQDRSNDLKERSQDLEKTEKEIEKMLLSGNREELVEQKQVAQKKRSQSLDGQKRALKGLAALIESKDLSASLIGKHANRGIEQLGQLNQKKQLPKVNVPILEELLDSETCFCGADLSPNSQSGIKARESIDKAIQDSKESDRLQEVATSLFYSVRSEVFGSENDRKWKESYDNEYQRFSRESNGVQTETDTLRQLEEKIGQVKDGSLSQLRDTKDILRAKIEEAQGRIGELVGKIEDAKSRKSEAEIDRDRTERSLSKSDTNNAKLKLCSSVESIFENIHERIMSEQLDRVSVEMNRIFLEMIGADPEANDLTVITKAELTEEFDILVYGQKGRNLNPDQDLNGASRRAITLAFILALTKVSKVQAPNVIDTPLGMMSGYVKRSVLSRTVEEGSQVILFLTHDEIAGVEDLISEYADEVYTLTNPAHYPKILANAPKTEDSRVIRCECSHLTYCYTCMRKIDIESPPEEKDDSQ